MIQITCSSRYCYEEFSPGKTGWRQIKVTSNVSQLGNGVRQIVEITALPLNVEALDLNVAHACPSHWEIIAHNAAKAVQIFPPEEENGEATS